MAFLSGVILVLLSWAVMLAAAVGAGLLPALAIHGRWSPTVLRAALWWGLGVLTVLITSLSLVFPLRTGEAAGVVVVVVLCLSAAGVWSARLLASTRRKGTVPRGRWRWIIYVGLGGGVLYLAATALGPVTNYDTGLYHLGAIAYAGDFRAIPGLANLYFPFGYANAHFPLAAFLGNGPWDGIGYRLLNGGLLAAMALDLGLRARRGRPGPGFFVLAVGSAAAFVPMVALSDYWVTSPTSDSAVLVLSLVSAAYLADAATGRRPALHASVAVVASVLSVMLRPTMAVFAVVTACVAVMLVLRARSPRQTAGRRRWPALVITGSFALLAGIVISARDVILSGWLQYPLSLAPVNVPWRAADPSQFRVPTLGAARDPEDLWAAADGWGWVPGWFGRLPDQWETYEFVLLLGVAVVLLLLAARSEVGLRVRRMALVMAPSLAMVLFWWVATPPSFRFIWGPLFGVVAVPAGWSLWRLSRPRRAHGAAVVGWLTALGVAVPILAVVAYCAVFRLDPASQTQQRTWNLGVSIPYAVAPLPDVPVKQVTLSSGLTVLVPTESDQCWTNYPLCTAQLAGSVTLRGTGIQDGFLP